MSLATSTAALALAVTLTVSASHHTPPHPPHPPHGHSSPATHHAYTHHKR